MDGWVRIGTELDTKNFESQIKEVEAKMEEIEHKLKQADMGFEVGDTVKLEAQYEKLNNQLGNLVRKQQELNRQDLSGISSSIDKVSDKVGKSIKNVVKWGLAVLGVRSAYLGIRRAMGIISRYNQQIGTDIEYMSYALATTLEPLIEKFVQNAYKLLQYVNYIAMAWFGVNIFAKASVDNFKGMNKQARELRKTLTGFDEMNVLGDSGSTGSLDSITPSVDLSQIQGDVPKWIEWIAENKNLVLGFFITLGTVWAGMKIMSFVNKLNETGKGIKKITELISKLGVASVVGWGLALAGVVTLATAVWKLVTGWNELSTKEKIILGMFVAIGAGAIVLGTAIATGISIATLGIGALIGLVAGLITAFAGWISKVVESNKELDRLADTETRLKEAKENLKKSTEDLADATLSEIDAMERAREEKQKLIEMEKRLGMSGADLQEQVESGTLAIEDMNSKELELYKQYQKSISAEHKYENAKLKTQEATEANIEWKKEEAAATELSRLETLKEKEGLEEFRRQTVKSAEEGKISWKDAYAVMRESMKEMTHEQKMAFTKELPDNLKKGLEPSKFSQAFNKLKNSFKGLWSDIKSGASGLWSNVTSGIGKFFGFSGGGLITSKPTYLATGGIINNPGMGVPLSRAIGGEAGAEGVIPLTDSQAMETLGYAIGRHITINADITNNMDGKVISREVKKIQGQQDFLMNR